jgi:hypothetical protein
VTEGLDVEPVHVNDIMEVARQRGEHFDGTAIDRDRLELWLWGVACKHHASHLHRLDGRE